MSETHDGVPDSDPAATGQEQGGEAEGSGRSRRRPGLRRLATLALVIDLALLAWCVHWESRHPAATFARRVRWGDVSARIAAVHQLENLGK
jgi:hypothetical protein